MFEKLQTGEKIHAGCIKTASNLQPSDLPCDLRLLFFSCALSHKSHTMSQFNSWVAGARASFLPNETQQQPDPGHQAWNLVITRPMPRSLTGAYHTIMKLTKMSSLGKQTL